MNVLYIRARPLYVYSLIPRVAISMLDFVAIACTYMRVHNIRSRYVNPSFGWYMGYVLTAEGQLTEGAVNIFSG